MTFWGGWKNSLFFLNNLSVDHVIFTSQARYLADFVKLTECKSALYMIRNCFAKRLMAKIESAFQPFHVEFTFLVFTHLVSSAPPSLHSPSAPRLKLEKLSMNQMKIISELLSTVSPALSWFTNPVMVCRLKVIDRLL